MFHNKDTKSIVLLSHFFFKKKAPCERFMRGAYFSLARRLGGSIIKDYHEPIFQPHTQGNDFEIDGAKTL